MFQFNVREVRGSFTLDCQLYQRSADVFLGVPFNIVSYAILTHMVAQVCDMKPGHFVHTFGDVHLYNNHVDQAHEQLTRNPLPLPRLELDPSIKEIDDFRFEHIRVDDYQYHPPIKAPVSI
jgi:thymidylate synthase